MTRTQANTLPPITEDEFLANVIAFAQIRGWRVAHFRPAKTNKGWRTAVQGNGKGFPDLIIVRDGRIVVAECKSEGGKLTVEQAEWIEAFRATTAETFVWFPSDWGVIDATLM